MDSNVNYATKVNILIKIHKLVRNVIQLVKLVMVQMLLIV
jgi:hypothetical protein